ncbi:amidohydrolase family protein [Candidatus Latescibacterota bacterium]
MKNQNFPSPKTRRDFLKHTGIIAAAAPIIANAATDAFAADAPFTDVVDCHIHLWAADKEKFPFHPNAPYRPTDRVSTIEQWLEDRKNSGVGIGIFVSAEPYQDDLRYVIHCMEKAPELLRGTCLFNPNAKESPRRMAEIVKGRNFVASRIHATGTTNSAEWRNPNFEAFWEKIGELDLVAQMHMHPEWGWELERMVKKYPDMRVVIDHLGRPRQGNPVDYQVILGLSDYPNVYIKLSSLADQSVQELPYDNLRPIFREIVRRYTPERLVWGDSYSGGMGSDAYTESMRITSRLLDFLTVEEQRKIFVETPRKLFKL